MALLAQRIAVVSATPSPCSLMVWPHALLPRQRLRIKVGPPFTELIEAELERNGTIALVASDLDRTTLLSHGVGVSVTHYAADANGTANVELLGLRRCELIELQADHSLQEWTGNRWFNAAVRWDEPAESSASAELVGNAERVEPLVAEWDALVRRKHERVAALDALLDELGPMPHATAPDALALWTAALLNPFPALVPHAPEIRQHVLTAPSVARRLEVVVLGLRDSIQALHDEDWMIRL